MNKRTIVKTVSFLLVFGATGYASYAIYHSYVHDHPVSGGSGKTANANDRKAANTVTYSKPRTYVGTKAAITSYFGEIQTEKNGQIYAYRDGIVEAYLANVGDTVKKWQVVAKLLPAEFNPDLANMIAEKRSMQARANGMVASAKITLENAKNISSRVTKSTDSQLDATVSEQNARIAKMSASLAALDSQISIQEKTIGNMEKKTVAGINLESDKLSLRWSTVKTAVKNAHATLFRVFYGSSALSSTYLPSQLKTPFPSSANLGKMNDFIFVMLSLHPKYQKIDTLSQDEVFSLAKDTGEAIDMGLKVLDSTATSMEYDEAMLNADKNMLIMAKTDEMNGIQTILNMYEEQSSMLAKEKAMAETDVQTERLMLEKMKAERKVMEKDLAMANAEKERMVAETKNMKTMSENEASKMEVEAQKMLIDANAELQAANLSLGILESAGFSNEVRAPFDGKITRRYVNAGESITMSTPLFDIVGSLAKKAAPKSFVRFEIPESDLADVAIGKEVLFYRTSQPLLKLSANIVRVSPAVGSATRGVVVEAEYAVDAKDMPIGSSVRVEMEKAGNMLLIPSASVVQSSDGKLSVHTVDAQGVVKSKPVTTERTIGLDVYVSAGLSKEDMVIELPKNYPFLEDGITVKAREKATVSAPASGSLSVPAEHAGHNH